MNSTVKINIEGIVQGVGFRPFIYNLAKKNDLKGYILNNSSGVEIEISGCNENISGFVEEVKTNPPKLSIITSLVVEEVNSNHEFKDFTIRESRSLNDKNALISPDIALCENCLSELFNPNDRRYKYPFINCTDCGPRYTIIENIPYDRISTSMNEFAMCRECDEEYHDPDNRRFHAQPNACHICGPSISLIDSNGNTIINCDYSKSEDVIKLRQSTEEIIKVAVSFLKEGRILAIKGLGGFHLAVDAENDMAVQLLRERKNRYEKPLALMSFSLDKIRNYAYIFPEDEMLLSSIQKPIVLLRKKDSNLISENVAPRNGFYGVMLPYTPLHYLLLENNFLALVMTSGNFSEEPICKNNSDSIQNLEGIADYFLIHNRDIYFRCDDSVVRNVYSFKYLDGGFQKEVYDEKNFSRIMIRRSRGYIPTPIFINEEIPQILAVGAELKNTICLTKGNRAFVSQHIGDLENIETLNYFEETIDHLTNILQISPDIIAQDLHPEYLSNKWLSCKESYFDKDIISVQHHFAHIVSCMAENRVSDTVIGFAMDGTGYGLDGNLWGGEIMICNYKYFQRHMHFEYFSLPGGDYAIKEPWRVGASLIYSNYGDDLFNLDIPFFANIETDKIRTITQMIKKNINTFKTSSLGRIFDAVAAIIGIRNKVSYEGQAATELENLIYSEKIEYPNNLYSFPIENNLIKLNDFSAELIADVKLSKSQAFISLKFHLSIVELFVQIANKIRESEKINIVALSGGCFQNTFLVDNLTQKLKENNFDVLTHRLLPPNDGGISLGQAIIAAYSIR